MKAMAVEEKKHRILKGLVQKGTGLVAGVALLIGGTALDAAPDDSELDTENITLSGVVTQNPRPGYFVIRASNGWTYRIDTEKFEPVRLTSGDRVRAYGDWHNGALIASNVRILEQGSAPLETTIHRNQSITGTVVEDWPNDDFVLRAGNGWTYLVRATWGEPSTLSAGDRLRAFGNWQDGMLHATNLRMFYDGTVVEDIPEEPVTVTTTTTTKVDVDADVATTNRNNVAANNVAANSGASSNRGALQGITRAGVVTQNLAGNEFIIRTANGLSYRVRALRGESSTLSVGDQVRVFGDLRNGIIDAVNVRIAYQAEDFDPDPYERNRFDYSIRDREWRTVTGVVTSNPSGDRFSMRSTNGYTYAVRARHGEPSTLTAGDRVRVYGVWSDGLFEAGNVRLLREGDNPKKWATHTWVGTVTENLEGDRFVIRAANGITYRVLAIWGEPDSLNKGDRVRAYGEWRNGMLHASNVRVLRQGVARI